MRMLQGIPRDWVSHVSKRDDVESQFSRFSKGQLDNFLSASSKEFDSNKTRLGSTMHISQHAPFLIYLQRGHARMR